MTRYASPDAVRADHRFVVALSGKLEPGVALNAASHLCLGLVAKAFVERPELVPTMSFLDFRDRDGGSHAPVSALSLVVLGGRGSHLRRFRAEAGVAGLLVTDFTATMTGDTYAEQLTRSAATSEADLEYYGVAAFGRRADLDPLTKRFSLWR
jgi:hypothetical protein